MLKRMRRGYAEDGRDKSSRQRLLQQCSPAGAFALPHTKNLNLAASHCTREHQWSCLGVAQTTWPEVGSSSGGNHKRTEKVQSSRYSLQAPSWLVSTKTEAHASQNAGGDGVQNKIKKKQQQRQQHKTVDIKSKFHFCIFYKKCTVYTHVRVQLCEC